MHRSTKRAAIGAGVLAFAAACLPAFAINEMFAKDAPIARMTAEDLDIWTAALRDALDRGRDGETFEWKNPATSASGTIRLLTSFDRQGMRCRGAAFTISARGESSNTAWNLCRAPEGWKFAEGR